MQSRRIECSGGYKRERRVPVETTAGEKGKGKREQSGEKEKERDREKGPCLI